MPLRRASDGVQETGKPFTVRRANGKLVLRDKGKLYYEQMYDTLGDGEPGGTEMSFEVVKQQGEFPGDTINWCMLAKRLTTWACNHVPKG